MDEISSNLILAIAEPLVVPITAIFKSSLENSDIPDDWKTANVTALFKKGSKKKACNYRPISLTSQIVKILEKIIKEGITNYLEKTI